METHAHHLHKAPGQGAKHYLFEFFMLFLAVTTGYFVENWRENYAESKRENQFINTLVEDLKSDTSQLKLTIEFKRTRELMVDSLALLIRSKERNKYGNEIYYFARSLTRARFFFPNDRTIQQLKNSGNLRLIHNLVASDNIMGYDQQVRYLLTNYESEREIVSNLREAEKDILDGQVLLGMIEGAGLYELKRPTTNPPLLTEDKTKLNGFIVQAQFVKSILNVTRQREEKLKQTAGELILFLKKEYHLE
jgi:hypothetical protein